MTTSCRGPLDRRQSGLINIITWAFFGNAKAAAKHIGFVVSADPSSSSHQRRQRALGDHLDPLGSRPGFPCLRYPLRSGLGGEGSFPAPTEVPAWLMRVNSIPNMNTVRPCAQGVLRSEALLGKRRSFFHIGMSVAQYTRLRIDLSNAMRRWALTDLVSPFNNPLGGVTLRRFICETLYFVREDILALGLWPCVSIGRPGRFWLRQPARGRKPRVVWRPDAPTTISSAASTKAPQSCVCVAPRRYQPSPRHPANERFLPGQCPTFRGACLLGGIDRKLAAF